MKIRYFNLHDLSSMFINQPRLINISKKITIKMPM